MTRITLATSDLWVRIYLVAMKQCYAVADAALLADRGVEEYLKRITP